MHDPKQTLAHGAEKAIPKKKLWSAQSKAEQKGGKTYAW